MQHIAYINGADIHVGTVISIATKTCNSGDSLAFVYPNNDQAPGKVISASPNELEVEINTETWRLRPHAPSDGQAHVDMAGLDASSWTVQVKL